jgi:hypothetical protein
MGKAETTEFCAVVSRQPLAVNLRELQVLTQEIQLKPLHETNICNLTKQAQGHDHPVKNLNQIFAILSQFGVQTNISTYGRLTQSVFVYDLDRAQIGLEIARMEVDPEIEILTASETNFFVGKAFSGFAGQVAKNIGLELFDQFENFQDEQKISLPLVKKKLVENKIVAEKDATQTETMLFQTAGAFEGFGMRALPHLMKDPESDLEWDDYRNLVGLIGSSYSAYLLAVFEKTNQSFTQENLNIATEVYINYCAQVDLSLLKSLYQATLVKNSFKSESFTTDKIKIEIPIFPSINDFLLLKRLRNE